MIHILALLLCVAGFAALAIAMDRHQRDLLGRKLAPRTARLVKMAGGGLLAVALAVDMIGLGAAYGAIAWFGHLSFGAAVVLTRITRLASARKPKSAPRTAR
ncbi:MAG: DUF3325 domain-containing protein [Sphingobium sp.]